MDVRRQPALPWPLMLSSVSFRPDDETGASGEHGRQWGHGPWAVDSWMLNCSIFSSQSPSSQNGVHHGLWTISDISTRSLARPSSSRQRNKHRRTVESDNPSNQLSSTAVQSSQSRESRPRHTQPYAENIGLNLSLLAYPC